MGRPRSAPTDPVHLHLRADPSTRRTTVGTPPLGTGLVAPLSLVWVSVTGYAGAFVLSGLASGLRAHMVEGTETRWYFDYHRGRIEELFASQPDLPLH